MKLQSLIDSKRYTPLLNFVNEPLSRQDWHEKLHQVESWQLECHLGLEASVRNEEPPRIRGESASYEKACELRASLRDQLNNLCGLASDRDRLTKESRESDMLARGGDRAWTWRQAQVLCTGQMFFDDAGEALNFLAEALESDIKQRVKSTQGEHRKPHSKTLRPCLHLSLCGCGCEHFFLWEGNWTRKQRRFISDKHRMDFHNRRTVNVRKKRRLAATRRADGFYQ
jgi:hypothetical protein